MRTQGYGEDATEAVGLLTIADLQRVLRTSRSTIYRLIREGELRPIYMDDRPRFRLHEIRVFLDSLERGPRDGR